MDSLVAKANAIRSIAKRRKTEKDDIRKRSKPSKLSSTSNDRTLVSVVQHTALPPSLRPSSPPPENVPKFSHIQNKKLRTQLTRQSTQAARSKALLKDAELLLTEDGGKIEVEGDLEKIWRLGQDEISRAAGQEAARGRKEWILDGGPYRSRYTRNGRCASTS